jgi:hypothetical protein
MAQHKIKSIHMKIRKHMSDIDEASTSDGIYIVFFWKITLGILVGGLPSFRKNILAPFSGSLH